MMSEGQILEVVVSSAAVVVLIYATVGAVRVLRREREVAEFLSSMMDEIRSKLALQEKRLLDCQVKLEILELRVDRSTPTRAPEPSIVGARTAPAPRQEPRQAIATRLVARHDVTSEITGPGEEIQDLEARILRLLRERVWTAVELRRAVGRSREHTARVMKRLHSLGLVTRSSARKPYVYSISEKGRAFLPIGEVND